MHIYHHACAASSGSTDMYRIERANLTPAPGYAESPYPAHRFILGGGGGGGGGGGRGLSGAPKSLTIQMMVLIFCFILSRVYTLHTI